MALARAHPYFGWLFLSGNEYRICFNKLIQMRDEQIKAGTYDSGIPEGYEKWAFENLKELVKIPIYKTDTLETLRYRVYHSEKEVLLTALRKII